MLLLTVSVTQRPVVCSSSLKTGVCIRHRDWPCREEAKEEKRVSEGLSDLVHPAKRKVT